MLGESPAQQRAKIEEASKNANDLTGLIKHKKKPHGDATVTNNVVNGSSKRKVEAEDKDERMTGKKAKVDDTGET